MTPSGTVAIVVASMFVVACNGPSKVVLGTGETQQPVPSGQGGQMNTGGAHGLGGAPPATGGVTPSGGGVGGDMPFPSATASAGGAATCVRLIAKPDVIPHDVYLMVDRSEGMNSPLPGSPGATYFDEVVRSLTLFLNEPAVGGVGLQFFPLGGAWLASCSADYATPEVEIDYPHRNGAALGEAMAAQFPRGPRPTGPALTGAIAHMTAWATEHASNAATVVLVTSGSPDVCTPEGLQGIADIAREGYESTPSVRTHVVAFSSSTPSPADPDASAADWDIVSLAGGTSAASIVGGADPGTTLHGALKRLLVPPASCRYELPTRAGSDDWSDPGRVTVTYDSAAGKVHVSRVHSLEECVVAGGGFQFTPGDAPSRPSRIELCPSTCDAVQGGDVGFSYGCPRPVPTE